MVIFLNLSEVEKKGNLRISQDVSSGGLVLRPPCSISFSFVSLFSAPFSNSAASVNASLCDAARVFRVVFVDGCWTMFYLRSSWSYSEARGHPQINRWQQILLFGGSEAKKKSQKKKRNRCEFALFCDQTGVKLRCSTTKELELWVSKFILWPHWSTDALATPLVAFKDPLRC